MSLLVENLKILVVGDFTGKGDEGLSQISKRIFRLLKDKNITMSVNTNNLMNIKTIILILRFNPDIIHYVTGPTIRSFIYLSFLKYLFIYRVKIVISATRPFLQKRYFKLLKFLPVDLIFTQANKWEIIFKKAGIKTSFLPNPIDIRKFNEQSINKNKLKKKFYYMLVMRKRIGICNCYWIFKNR